MSIIVEDSGSGFDISTLKTADNNYSGRGLALMKSLCESIEHNDDGRSIKVVFQWQYT